MVSAKHREPALLGQFVEGPLHDVSNVGVDLVDVGIIAEFGENPDIDEVDAHVRHVMQRALDELAEERTLPVLG